MYRKISMVAYLNIVVVVIIGVLHEQIESISMWLLFLLLMAYALINSLYVQRELHKQNRLENKLRAERTLSSKILSSIPTGIIIINTNGRIKYVNEAIKNTLGIENNNHINYLEEVFFKHVDIDDYIEQAILGVPNDIKEIKYKSKQRQKLMVLNCDIHPFRYDSSVNKYEIMLLINEITEAIELKEKVEEQYFNMFKSFAKFIDAKDSYTGKHSNNVSIYTDLLLNEMIIDPLDKHEIQVAAALHDIGKIGIKESILNKPGKLSDAEYSAMKMHPSIGAELLTGIEDFKNVSRIIRHHHERWDGNGYPAKLQGDEIPLGAQLISVADAYDAITSERIYQKARSPKEAQSILLAEKNKQFNGKIVDLFIKCLQTYEND